MIFWVTFGHFSISILKKVFCHKAFFLEKLFLKIKIKIKKTKQKTFATIYMYTRWNDAQVSGIYCHPLFSE